MYELVLVLWSLLVIKPYKKESGSKLVVASDALTSTTWWMMIDYD